MIIRKNIYILLIFFFFASSTFSQALSSLLVFSEVYKILHGSDENNYVDMNERTIKETWSEYGKYCSI